MRRVISLPRVIGIGSLSKIDLTNEYQGDFEEMTVDAVPLESLLETRETLIDEIARRARLPASRSFLQSFFACEPDWSLLDLAADISALPAVQWKLRNLERLRAEQPAKFERELARLDEALR